MKSFTLKLQDASHAEEIAQVNSFVGEDASGNFGILADHARFMTSLVVGLARFRTGNKNWQYLALPGAVLYFCNNVLTLSTRHYLIDDDYMHISQALQQELVEEEKKLLTIKESLYHMEEEVLKHLWEMSRERAGWLP
ncbi:MAG: F0F1 ATP synthase subunit epsilon [Deltaproteobacteria bacterium]|jgi:F-type H+-transporting ATPase subunit epsilon|nr:F0F1 ATP synthase subunit epsilon [Deltaproteobacteria bacterium]MCW8893189.1 F0F1 ATP synthase subunit epsilon [Deltaproteobacteria bacterium]MCW9049319.1 F0F1 ATP synthase subunit epsilon [Deltaproteobacteria bacterium]